MKNEKLILSLIVIIFCFTANAHEAEKKKETKSTITKQERAIIESCVSVKA